MSFRRLRTSLRQVRPLSSPRNRVSKKSLSRHAHLCVPLRPAVRLLQREPIGRDVFGRSQQKCIYAPIWFLAHEIARQSGCTPRPAPRNDLPLKQLDDLAGYDFVDVHFLRSLSAPASLKGQGAFGFGNQPFPRWPLTPDGAFGWKGRMRSAARLANGRRGAIQVRRAGALAVRWTGAADLSGSGATAEWGRAPA
jgi:hypothetical protein